MWGIAGQDKHGNGRLNFRGNHQENKTCGYRMKEVDLLNMEKGLTLEA